MAEEIKNILVVGAGVMGSAISQVFAANGYKTVMADLKEAFLETALKRIETNIDGMEEENLADGSYRKAVHENLITILNSLIPEKADRFDLVVEVIFENKDAKHELYKVLSDNCRPDCIFASNTSGMDVFSVTGTSDYHPLVQSSPSDEDY